MKVRTSTKFRWKRADVLAKVDAARLRGLRNAGSECRKQITRSMSNPRFSNKPKYWPLSRDVTRTIRQGSRTFQQTNTAVAVVYDVPKPAKVSSRKGGVYPKGFLRQSIEYDYDPSRDSVVVGPAHKKAWLNEIHEFGASQTFYLVPTSPPKGAPKKYRRNTFVYFSDEPTDDSVSFGTRKIKARPFVGPGVAKAMPKIPKMFANQLRRSY